VTCAMCRHRTIQRPGSSVPCPCGAGAQYLLADENPTLAVPARPARKRKPEKKS